jgi:pimeloyl-ACP methyl ester carboxylesterase
MASPRLDVKIVGEGENLVLINALLSDRSAYEPLAERLSDQRRLIMVNLPGFGASPKTARSLDDYADAVAGLFDDLALPPSTDILANGLGSFVASRMAIRHGDKFRKLVLVGSGAAFPEAGRATFRALADKVDAEGMDAVAGAAVKRMFPDEYAAANPAVVAERERVFKSIDPEIFAMSCRLLADLDLGPDLQKIRNPVLVVIGAVDGATPPAIGHDLARRLPDAHAIEMPGVGHVPHVQAPDEFVAVIAPFLGLKARS